VRYNQLKNPLADCGREAEGFFIEQNHRLIRNSSLNDQKRSKTIRVDERLAPNFFDLKRSWRTIRWSYRPTFAGVTGGNYPLELQGQLQQSARVTDKNHAFKRGLM
jgi:hypothetical protein